jgi:predicted aspartyl protease
MQVPFFISGVQKVENALVDSGATDNFITPLLAKRMGLQIQRLKNLKHILTVDGSEHKQGKLTEYMDLILRLGKQRRKQRFYIATLGHDRAILGFPFLNKFNPAIDWAKNEIIGHKGVQVEPESEDQEASLIKVLLLQNEAIKQCGEPAEGEEL